MTGAERIFDAITDVCSDYVDAAGDFRFSRRRSLPAALRRYGALAACLALILGGALALSQVRMGGMAGGNTGWSGGTDGGGWVFDSAAGGGNTASAPEGCEPGDALPPAEPDAGAPPSGEGGGDMCGGSFPCWDSAAGAVPVPAIQAEGAAATREITLCFREDGAVEVKDRYLFTAGADGGRVSVRYDGPGRLSQARNTDGGWQVSLAAGDVWEITVSTCTDALEGVLPLAEPEGVAEENTTVIVEGRRWMEARGVAVMLGDTPLDP